MDLVSEAFRSYSLIMNVWGVSFLELLLWCDNILTKSNLERKGLI